MRASRAGLFVPFDSEFLRDQCDNRSGVLPTLKQRGAGNPGVGGGGEEVPTAAAAPGEQLCKVRGGQWYEPRAWRQDPRQ